MKQGKGSNVWLPTLTMILGCLIGGQAALAADYPNHPVKLVVGFPPGGPASNAATLMAKRASEFLPQPITVEYKPGGSGVLGANFVINSKPDGYTLYMGAPSPLLIAPLITPDVGYTLEDFVPIIGYCVIPTMINAKKGRWKTLNEMIAEAKKNPGKISFSTQGVNSISHFFVEILCKKAGIKLNHVPFPGTAESNAALLGGHIDLTIVGGSSGLYEGGLVDVLAVAEEKRLKEFPAVPTLVESGYPIVFNVFYFLCAPKGIPQEARDKLYEANKKAYAKYGDEINGLFRKLELYPAFGTPEEVRTQNNLRRDMIRDAAKDMGVLINK